MNANTTAGDPIRPATGPLSARTAAAYGRDPSSLAAAQRAGELVRLRRGVYGVVEGLDPVARHRLLVEAARGVLRPDAVVSHCSAAVLHGLDVPWAILEDRVHITRGRSGGSLRDRLATHTGPVPDGQWTVVDGLRATTVIRTAVDLARTTPLRDSIAVLDHVLRHHGGERARAQMLAICAGLAGCKGVGRARDAIAFADPRAENGGESASRVVLHAMGLPAPVPQFEVLDRHGWFVGRSDFGWPERGVLGEFDGLLKYRELPQQRGERPGEVVAREKQREDDLRAEDWEVVRWVYAELERPEQLAAKVRAAFARAAARRAGPRDIRGR